MPDPIEYLTELNLRFALMGAGAGVLASALLGLLRRRVSALLGFLAPALGLFVADWWAWPDTRPDRLLPAVVVGGFAGGGYERLASSGGWRHLAPLVLLVCLGGVWLAVPENNPTVVLLGVVLGLLLVGRSTDGVVGYGLGLAAAWSVLLGAADGGYSFDGGLLCLGPLAAVPLVDSVVQRRGVLPAWPWYIVGAGAVSFAAARWVGVAPEATWTRVAMVGAAAAVLAAVTRR